MATPGFDFGPSRDQFQREVYLRCPRCERLAISRVLRSEEASLFAPRRLTCIRCGYTRQWNSRAIGRADGRLALDDYFHLPLFLQVPCASGVLWAYNPEHVSYLASWLSVRLRSRVAGPHGWSNASALSRLPRWLKSCHNRKAIQGALVRLQQLSASSAA